MWNIKSVRSWLAIDRTIERLLAYSEDGFAALGSLAAATGTFRRKAKRSTPRKEPLRLHAEVLEPRVVMTAPTAVADYYSLWNDQLFQPQSPGILMNDSNPESSAMTAVLVDGAGPSHGTFALNSNGSFTYTALTGYIGSDQFAYQAFNGEFSNVTYVTLDITSRIVITAPPTQSASEGDSHAFSLGSFSDGAPGGPWSATVMWGDGGMSTFSPTGPGSLGTAEHAYGSEGNYTVTVQVANQATGQSASANFSAQVANVAPSGLTLTAPTEIAEGTPLTLQGSFVDPGFSNSHTVSITWGQDEWTQTVFLSPGTLNFSVDHTFVDDTPEGLSNDIEVTVTDSSNDNVAGQVTVPVTNVAPTLTEITAVASETQAGLLTVAGTITDPGVADSFVLWIFWGDSPEPEQVDLPAGATAFSVTHDYDADNPWLTLPATFSILLEVTDDDGGTGQASVAATLPSFTSPIVPASSRTYTVQQGQQLSATGADSLRPPPAEHLSPLEVAKVTDPRRGDLTLNADGTFLYTPLRGFVGSDTFSYVFDNGLGDLSNVGTVTINVTNTAPVAGNITFANVPAGQSFQGSGSTILAQSTDADGDALLAANASAVSNGTLSWNPDGTFTYTPNMGFTGNDSFTFFAFDGATQSSSAGTITFQVTDTAPIAVAATIDVPAGKTFTRTTSILPNETVASLVTGTTHGNLILSVNGTFTYTPHTGFKGTDQFTFRAYNGTSYSVTRAITLTVVDEAPAAVANTYEVHAGRTFQTVAANGVLANDSDPAGKRLIASLVTGAANGTLELKGDGSFTYTSRPGFVGTDQFTYRAFNSVDFSETATVTLVVSNTAPVAQDNSYTAVAAIPDSGYYLINIGGQGVLGNDTDADWDALTVRLVSSTSKGWLQLYEDGSFKYNPRPGVFGVDQFSYQAFDGTTASATATVTINLTNTKPVAQADVYGLSVGQTANPTLTVDRLSGLLANDSDVDWGQKLSVNLLQGPSNGRLAVDFDGSFSYSPRPGFAGVDTFIYQASDSYTTSDPVIVSLVVADTVPGSVPGDFALPAGETLEVSSGSGLLSWGTGVVPPLTWRLHLVSGTANGSLFVSSDGSFRYTPRAGFAGNDAFVYQVTDGIGYSAPASVSLTVIGTNTPLDPTGSEPPVAMLDAYAVHAGASLSVDAVHGALANDYDPDARPMAASLVNGTIHGSLLFNADGSFSYTPNAGFTGIDTFVYQVWDGVNFGNLTTVRILVTDTSSVALEDAYSAHSGAVLSIAGDKGALANDLDADGEAFFASLVSGVAHGILTFSHDGSFQYMSSAEYVGNDSFTYQISDGALSGNLAIVWLTVSNTAPATADDAYLVHAGTPLGIALQSTPAELVSHDMSAKTVGAIATSTQLTPAGVLANDADVDQDALTARLVTLPAHGSVILQSDGTLLYTPTPGYLGTDSFSYQSFDGVTLGNEATVRLLITDQGPVARTDSYAVHATGILWLDTDGQSTTFNITGNDIDVENDALRVQPLNVSVHGTIAQQGNALVFTPVGGFTGEEFISYRVSDGALTADGSVRVVVSNTPPTARDDAYAVRSGKVFSTINGGGGMDVAALRERMYGPEPPVLPTNVVGTASNMSPRNMPPNPGTGPFASGSNDLLAVLMDSSRLSADTGLTTHVSVLTNDSDTNSDTIQASLVTPPAHGLVILQSDGNFVYAPNPGYTGEDSFQYRVLDGIGTGNIATVSLQVVNEHLWAADDVYRVTAGKTNRISVADGLMANDTYPATASSVAVLQQPSHGFLVLQPNGAFTYTPNPSAYIGPDSFTYRLTNNGQTSIATVTLSVEDDQILSPSLSYTVHAGRPLIIDSLWDWHSSLLYFTTGGNGSEYTTYQTDDTLNGHVEVDLDGSFVYTPDEEYVGADSFHFVITDGVLWSEPILVTILVQNSDPIAVGDYYSVVPNTSASSNNSVEIRRLSGVNSLIDNDIDADNDTLVPHIQTNPTKGTLTRTPGTGNYRYRPNVGATGQDTFTYAVWDGISWSNSATVTISLTANQVQVLPDFYATAKGVTLTISNVAMSVLANDTTVLGGTKTPSIVQQPANGTVTLNADGTFTYVPNATWTGDDRFKYRMTAQGAMGEAFVTITVYDPAAGDVDLPAKNIVPRNDNYIIDRDFLLIGANVDSTDSRVTNNDEPAWIVRALAAAGNYLAEAATLGFYTPPPQVTKVRVTTPVTVGTLYFAGDGSLIYQPPPHWTGTTTFQYTSESKTPATVTIEVRAPALNPQADSYTVVHDRVLTVEGAQGLMGNDEVGKGGSSAGLGGLGLDSNANEYVREQEEQQRQEEHQRRVRLAELNDEPPPPFNEPPPKPGRPAEQEGMEVQLVTGQGPSHGQLKLFANGSFDYLPNQGYVGTDTFQYRLVDPAYPSGTDRLSSPVTVTLTVTDSLAVAKQDQFRSPHDTTLFISPQDGVLKNDEDADGDFMKARLERNALHGAVTLMDSGAFAYTPNAGFVGTDLFLYRALARKVDSLGNETWVAGNLIPALIQVTNQVPDAKDDSYTVLHDTKLIVSPLTGMVANDTDQEGDTMTITVLDAVQHGTLTWFDAGAFTYQPNAGFSGTDLFTYQVSDGFGPSRVAAVTITVTASPAVAAPDGGITTNDAALIVPMAQGVLVNDTDQEGNRLTARLHTAGANTLAQGTITLNATGSYTYTPPAGFIGSDLFTYQVNNGLLESNIALVALRVTHGLPTAGDDAFDLIHGLALSTPPWLGVLSNVSGLTTGGPLTTLLVAGPRHGALTLNPGGSFLYVPDPTFIGNDIFLYKITDGLRESNIAAVTLRVKDGPPTVPDASFATPHDEPLLVSAATGLLSGAGDANADTVRVTVVSSPLNGAVTWQPDGAIAYQPNAGFVGTDAFVVQVGDGLLQSRVAAVRVAVTETAPEAKATYQVLHDTKLIVNIDGGVFAFAGDAEGDEITSKLVRNVAHGSLTYQTATGAFIYTPEAHFAGLDSFVVRLTDGLWWSRAVTVRLIVSNDVPIGQDEVYVASPNATLTVPEWSGVLRNDHDLDGDRLNVHLLAGPTHGSLQIGEGGSFSYTPNAGFTGIDGFSYAASDGMAESLPVQVLLRVAPPTAVDDRYSVPTGQSLAITSSAQGVLGNDVDWTGEGITASLLRSPAHGSLSFSSNGSFTYVPDTGFVGTDTFTYHAHFTTAESNSATVTIQVLADDSMKGSEDRFVGAALSRFSVDADHGVLANDRAPSGATLTAVPINDTVTENRLFLNADGSFAVTLGTSNYTFAYTLTDGVNFSAPIAVTIVAAASPTIPARYVEAGPRAVNDRYFLAADGTLVNVPSLLMNDLGLSLDAEATLVNGPSHGVLSLNLDGTFVYVANKSFPRTDTFTYAVHDGAWTSAPAVVTLTAYDSLPPAPSLLYHTSMETALVIGAGRGLLASSDPEGDTVKARLVSGALHGAVTVNLNGSFTYVPATGFHGFDAFTYAIDDGLMQAVRTATIQVNGAPAVHDHHYRVVLGETLAVPASLGVLRNAYDADGLALAAVLVGGPQSGSLDFNTDGSFVYSEPLAYGSFTFTYRALNGTADSNLGTVTIEVTNQLRWTGDDAYHVPHNQQLQVSAGQGVLSNDSTIAGLAWTADVVSGPSHGALTFQGDGSFTYAPDALYAGTDSFTYHAADSLGVSNLSTVYLVTDNAAPFSGDGFFEVATNRVLALPNLLANDVDADTGVAAPMEIVNGPSHGALAVLLDGTLTYTPALNFHGNDSFTYRSSDGKSFSNLATVHLRVTNAIVARDDSYRLAHDDRLIVGAIGGLLANDSDANGLVLTSHLIAGPGHGTLNLSADGSLVYTPNAGFSGMDSFTYEAHDGYGISNTATVGLVVLAPVIAFPDQYTTHAGQTLQVSWWNGVQANDAFADQPAATASLLRGPSHGVVSFLANGGFTYTPAVGFSGIDYFTYQLANSAAAGNTGLVTITVADAAPITVTDTYTIDHDTVLVVPSDSGVLVNDSDLDGDFFTAQLVTGPAHGVVDLLPTGAFTYTPALGYAGLDTFVYQAFDGALASVPTVVSLTVANSVVAVSDTYNVVHDRTFVADGSLRVLANDSDPQGEPLAAGIFTLPSFGSIVLQANGSFVYVPLAGFVGTDSFIYRAADPIGGFADAVVTLNVTDSLASGGADTYTVLHDQTLLVNGAGVLGNDSDANGDRLSAVLAVLPTSGLLDLRGNGAFSYKPNAGFVGTDTFKYRAFDGALLSDLITVTITVANQAPSAVNDTYEVMHDIALLALSNEAGELPGDGVLEPVNRPDLGGELTLQSESYSALQVSIPSGKKTLLANDNDVDGDKLTVTLAAGGAPTHGTLTLKDNGAFLYVPHPAYIGPDTFSYVVSDGVSSALGTVSITVKGKNPQDVGMPNEVLHMGILTINDVQRGVLHGNGGDNGERAQVAVQQTAALGSLTLNANGTYMYEPDPTLYLPTNSLMPLDSPYIAVDSFTFNTVVGSNPPGNPQNVTLYLRDEKPKGPSLTYGMLIAAGSTSLTVPKSRGLLEQASDANLDTLTAVRLSGPQYGTLVMQADGTFTYTPASTATTYTDSFTYAIYDGPAGTLATNMYGQPVPTRGWKLSDPITVTLEITSDVNRVTELVNGLEFASARGRIDWRMSQEGREPTLQKLRSQFQANSNYGSAVLQADQSFNTQGDPVHSQVWLTWLQADADYAAASAQADRDAVQSRADASRQNWSDKADHDIFYQTTLANSDRFHQQYVAASSISYQSAQAAWEASLQQSQLAAEAAHDLDVATADAALMITEANARLAFQTHLSQIQQLLNDNLAAAANQRDGALASALSTELTFFRAAEQTYEVEVASVHAGYAQLAAVYADQRDQAVQAALATYNQAIAQAGATYAQGPDDAAASGVWNVANDPGYLQAVANAQAAYDAQVKSHRDLYDLTMAVARQARDAALISSNSTYDQSISQARATYRDAVTQANAAFAQSTVAAQAIHANARGAAEDTFAVLVSNAQLVQAIALQAANVALEGSQRAADQANANALLQAGQQRDASITQVQANYDQSYRQAETQFETSRHSAQVAAEADLSAKVQVFDAAIVTAESTFKTASAGVSATFDAAVLPLWNQFNSASWTALLVHDDDLRVAGRAFNEAALTIDQAYHTVADPRERQQNQFDLLSKIALRGGYGQAMGNLLIAHRNWQAWKTAVESSPNNSTYLARNAAAFAAYQFAQKTLAVAMAQSDLAQAQTVWNNAIGFWTDTKNVFGARAGSQAQANLVMVQQGVRADERLTSATADASSLVNMGLAQAAATATAVLAPAARDQAIDIADAARDWQNAIADNGATQDQAAILALNTFQHDDAAAYEFDQNAEADARQVFADAASLAGKMWSLAQEAGWVQWVHAAWQAQATVQAAVSQGGASRAHALALADNTYDLSIDAAGVAWWNSVSDAGVTAQQAQNQAAYQRYQFLLIPAIDFAESGIIGAFTRDSTMPAPMQVGISLDRYESALAWAANPPSNWNTHEVNGAYAWNVAQDENAWAQQTLHSELINLQENLHVAALGHVVAASTAQMGAWHTAADSFASTWGIHDKAVAQTQANAHAQAIAEFLTYQDAYGSAWANHETAVVNLDAALADSTVGLEQAALPALLNLSYAQDQADAAESRASDGVWSAAFRLLQDTDADSGKTKNDAFSTAQKTQERDQALADVAWSNTVWNKWSDSSVAQTAADAQRMSATAPAEAQTKKDLAHAESIFGGSLSQVSYTAADQGRDVALAQATFQISEMTRQRDDKVDKLQREVALRQTAFTANSQYQNWNYVSLTNPNGEPPPPRYNGPRYSSDIVRQLMLDMDRISVEGGQLTVGDLRAYNITNPGGPTSAHEALAQASQLSLQLINNVLSIIPGPLGMGIRFAQLIDALTKGDMSAVGPALIGVLSRFSPCGRGLVLAGLSRAASIQAAAQGIAQVIVGLQTGDPMVGFHLFGAAQSMFNLFKSCFTGDTLLLTKDGMKRIDEFTIGDKLLSRSEFDVNGPVEEKTVLDVFVRTAPIWNLHIGGKIIRTTATHPFYVFGKGWIPTSMLQPGDLVPTDDGKWLPVEGVANSGEVTTVFNLEVDDFHTYFVSGQAWGFSVWAHNDAYVDKAIKNQNARVKSGPNKGQIRYIDPKTNKAKTTDRKNLDGDHVLSKAAFNKAVKKRERELNRDLTEKEKNQVRDLMNSKDNLRPMPNGHNRAKGKRSADEYADTPTGQKASSEYVRDMRRMQGNMQNRLDALLNSFN